MEKYSITINYDEKLNELNRLHDVIDSFNERLGQFHVVRKTEKEVMENLYKLLDERTAELKETYNKIVNFFKGKENKLWLMRITKGSGEYKYIGESFIYIYHIQEANKMLECLHSSDIDGLCSSYKFSFTDECVDIESLCYGHGETVIELKETTKEKAFEMFNHSINKIIDTRIEKIMSRI